MENICGAFVERGRVMRIEESGKCIIASIDRPGVVSLPLSAGANLDIEVGSVVIYCEFADGQGAVFMTI